MIQKITTRRHPNHSVKGLDIFRQTSFWKHNESNHLGQGLTWQDFRVTHQVWASAEPLWWCKQSKQMEAFDSADGFHSSLYPSSTAAVKVITSTLVFPEVTSTHLIFKYLYVISHYTCYLLLLPDPSTLQVLVEAAQHMISSCSHFWIVTA